MYTKTSGFIWFWGAGFLQCVHSLCSVSRFQETNTNNLFLRHKLEAEKCSILKRGFSAFMTWQMAPIQRAIRRTLSRSIKPTGGARQRSGARTTVLPMWQTPVVCAVSRHVPQRCSLLWCLAGCVELLGTCVKDWTGCQKRRAVFRNACFIKMATQCNRRGRFETPAS